MEEGAATPRAGTPQLYPPSPPPGAVGPRGATGSARRLGSVYFGCVYFG